MTTDLVHPVRSTSSAPLLTAVRSLAALHGVVGLVGLGYAAWAIDAYNDAGPDETFAGLLIFFAGIYGITGLVLVILALGAWWARTPNGCYACGLAAGLFVILAVIGGGWFFIPSYYLLLAALPLVLVVLSVLGLARGSHR